MRTYCALMRLLASMTAHVNDKHVLSFERFFVARASLPAADKRFLIAVNMIGVDVTDKLILREEFEAAASPMTVRFEENAPVIFCVCGVSQDRFAARATVIVVTHRVFSTKNVFVCAAEAVLLHSAVEFINVTGILMVQMRTSRRQLAVLNDVVVAGIVRGFILWLSFPHV